MDLYKWLSMHQEMEIAFKHYKECLIVMMRKRPSGETLGNAISIKMLRNDDYNVWDTLDKMYEQYEKEVDYPCRKCDTQTRQSCCGCPEEKAWREKHKENTN